MATLAETAVKQRCGHDDAAVEEWMEQQYTDTPK